MFTPDGSSAGKSRKHRPDADLYAAPNNAVPEEQMSKHETCDYVIVGAVFLIYLSDITK
jgi:hypothetical protein